MLFNPSNQVNLPAKGGTFHKINQVLASSGFGRSRLQVWVNLTADSGVTNLDGEFQESNIPEIG
jgi:hypothetical protein